MRDAEVRNLKWEQIDFLDQILTVGKSKTAAGTGRRIPLNSAVMGALADHMKWYEQAVGSPEPNCYVFPGGAHHYDPNKPLTSLKTSWTTLRRKTGIKTRWHDNRHTLVTKLAESGVGDETVRQIAGHVSQQMLSHYSHVRIEARREALENMRNLTKGDTIPESPE